MAGLISDDLENYISSHSESGGNVEKELRQETLALGSSSGMMSGDSVGNFLKFIVKINKCKRVLEIGTFTGYSALMLASGLQENGELITCDINSETSDIAKKYWAKSSHGKKIKLVLGPAIESMEKLNGKFDLIFIDADKNNYLNYYIKSKDLLNKNGIIIVDNVLWSGRVLSPEDKQSVSIDNFNKFVNGDKDWWNTIVPIRDGLMIITRR
ncbi:MAG: methyltransferase [Chloroflexi bacterium]|nr:methyltransferase [Chloroflexota bacterium]|tara:strand:- start:1080 stop:1715 length:636 start_codon:yes stop_codon:yes gene_type:complete